jgi:class 3 adenylate cyclase/tetratricopeptide (TPR) repeat protein
MSTERQQLENTIAALEAQRALLGNQALEMVLGPLRRKLAALHSPEFVTHQQLKQVSVLFVDMVGSTAMGERLDPEQIHAVIDGALERFAAVVHAHHGRVLKYTGDGMLAAFGTDTASEDDAEEAVRAGLAVIEAAREHAPRVQREFGVPDFNVRAGIHTGRVLLGGGVDAEGSIRGATVNVAARMEQSAPVGGLRISHDTWRLVRGLFAVAEQPPIRVKGVEEPLRSYLVQRERPRALRVPTRGIEGMDTRMVGRDSELGALCAAFDDVSTEGTLRAITVVGEAGLGKSRLLAEFQQQLNPARRRCWLLASRAHPRSALYAYGQLRDLLAWQLQIDDSDNPEVARDKLMRGLAPMLPEPNEAGVHVLGHLIGLDFSASPHVERLLHDEAQMRARGFETAALCLRGIAAAKNAPVVVVFDDLHWADDGSIAFVRHLLVELRDMPLMCLVLARPTLFERVPGWAEGDALHRRIDIRPLDKADTGELAGELLQRIIDAPEALRDIVTASAEGNPFYMEELVKMLIDDGVIVVDPDGWRVLPEQLAQLRVPPTLAAVLQARLDTLDIGERTALQQAAIVGHVFGRQALGAIDPVAVEALPALLRRQLVTRRDAQGDEGEFAFQHHLLHQVTYDSVLKESRRKGHERVGAFWSARAEVATPQQVTRAGRRALAEAHDHRQLADPAAFASWFDAQFFNYLNAYAGATLLPLAQSVVKFCESHHGPDHVETARALTNLARVLVQLSELEMAEPTLRRALAIQELALGPEHPDTARTLAVLGGYFQGRGDYAAAEPFLRRALAVRERVLGLEDPLTLGTLEIVAHVVAELGRLDEAEAMSRRVLQARERTLGPEATMTAEALRGLSEVLAKKGDALAAEPLLRRALAVQRSDWPMTIRTSV